MRLDEYSFDYNADPILLGLSLGHTIMLVLLMINTLNETCILYKYYRTKAVVNLLNFQLRMACTANETRL